MMSDEAPKKTVITESTVVTKRAEGENASVSFTSSKHMAKWLAAGVGLMFANLSHSIVSDFLPAKGEAGREEVKQTSAIAVGRNDDDNRAIKEKLDAILAIKGDVDTLKADMADVKNNVRDMNRRIDDVLLKTK